MPIDRRFLITGLASFLAAPAIVRASSLMPVRVLTAASVWKRYSGYEVLNISPSDVFTIAEFPLREVYFASH